MHRIDQSEQEGLPTIVAQVIGYAMAAEIFNLMDTNSTVGIHTPDEWKGELNVTYSLGGKLKDDRFVALYL